MAKYENLSRRIFKGVGEYGIPEIYPAPLLLKPSDWCGFNYAKSKMDKSLGIHFFLEDYQFERVWRYPDRYVEVLRDFRAVLTPDFSLYTDFPRAVQIYNHYRKHWVGAYWQENGLTVIPTIAWSDRESFDWCLDGEPEGGIVAVSNIGCMKRKDERAAFMAGYNEMLTRLQPSKVLFFAYTMDDYKGNVEWIKYDPFRGGRKKQS